jgi:hypothetical protein
MKSDVGLPETVLNDFYGWRAGEAMPDDLAKKVTAVGV